MADLEMSIITNASLGLIPAGMRKQISHMELKMVITCFQDILYHIVSRGKSRGK